MRIKHSQTEMGFVFHSQLWVLLFLLVHHLFIIFFLFSLPSLHIYLWTQHTSLNILSCWLLVCGKPHHLALIVYSF